MKSNFAKAAALALTLSAAHVSFAGLRPDNPPSPPPVAVNPEPPVIDEPPIPPPPPVCPPPPPCHNAPEPGTMVLALSAAGLAGIYTRRKRKQAS